MYTYNPQWGSSLEKRKKLPGASFVFFYVGLVLVLFLAVHSFIYSFISLLISTGLLCLPVWLAFPSRGSRTQGGLFPPPPSVSLLLSSQNPLVPWFYPLRSFVIFGRVSDTRACLGNRSERPSGFVAQRRRRRRGDTWQGWTHDGGKVGGVVRKQWNADQKKVILMRLNRPPEETTLSTLSWNHRLWSS